MSIAAITPRKRTLLGLGGALVLGAGAWKLACFERAASIPPSNLQQEFSVAALKSLDPEGIIATIQEALQRTDLTDEQRRELIGNGRAAIEQRRQEQVDEYFACHDPEARKNALDRHIDDMQTSRKKLREDRERTGAKEWDARQQKTRDFLRGHENSTQPARKPRPAKRSADQKARWMTYHAALQARLRERGIEPSP